MSFQATLILSNVLFLSGFLGVKLWDLLSGRDHVWEYVYAEYRRRAFLPKLNVARPALGQREELRSQVHALGTEVACLVFALMPALLWGSGGAKGTEARSLADAHSLSVVRLFFGYGLLLAPVRLLWWRKFAKR